MNIVKPLLLLIGFVSVVVGIQPPPALASVGEQQLQVDEDWIFRMRGDLSVQFAPDRVIVSSKNLKLTVLESYPYGPIKPNYITIDLVNRNPGQRGWNVLSTTRQLDFGPLRKTMNRGDAHLFSFEESIPFQFPPNFKYEEHWLVLTVHETNQRSSGTVHAHTKPFARPTTLVAPIYPSSPSSSEERFLPSSPAASDGKQQLQINKDWIFSMRGQLSTQLSSNGILVSTNNLSLTVLDNYQYAPLTANYITIDLVNRNPGQRGWNVLSTTREIKFGRVVRNMDRGDTHVFSFTESIPYKFPSDFRYDDHWLVLTVSVTSNGSSGTVHAHTERLRPPNVAQPLRISSARSKPLPLQEVIFTSSSDSTAAHSGAAILSSTGPFLVLKFSDYLIRTDHRNHGSTVNVSDIRFRLVSKSKMPDGTHIIRESEPVTLNLRLKDRITRGINLPDVKIPIDGISFDDLGDYRLIADLRISNSDVGIPSEAYPSIDPSRLL